MLGDEDDAKSINGCASVKTTFKVLSGGKIKANNDKDNGDCITKRAENAKQVAEKFKDYPNQIPLAILTALGEIDVDDTKEAIDEKVKGLNKKILDKNPSGMDSDVGVFKSNDNWGTAAIKYAAEALKCSIVLMADYGDGLKPTFYPSYGVEINDKIFYDAQKVFPKSIAERMLWIKAEKKEGAEGKVTYAVDFDTAEDFKEEKDVPLAFETQENKEGEVIKKWKQLIVDPGKLEYLRYSLDPKAFLGAFLSGNLQDDEEECKLKLPVSQAEPSFFDALQAMCEEGQSSNYKISIGYGSADNSKDAKIQKLVNDRFDPRAKTYVVFEGKATFRYAEGDEDNENTELGRFKKFKDENRLDEDSTFDDIEKAKRKWFESEAKRVKEEAEAEEEEKRKADRQVLVDKFNLGGEITVDEKLIQVLSEENIIKKDRAGNFSVISVIEEAVEAGSKVTKLNVTFDTVEQCRIALEILAQAANDPNGGLQLNVLGIRDCFSGLSENRKQKLLSEIKNEKESRERARGVRVMRRDREDDELCLKILGRDVETGTGVPLKRESRLIYVDKDALNKNEERLRKEQEEEDREQKEAEEEAKKEEEKRRGRRMHLKAEICWTCSMSAYPSKMLLCVLATRRRSLTRTTWIWKIWQMHSRTGPRGITTYRVGS